jgi:hypothetical protein
MASSTPNTRRAEFRKPSTEESRDEANQRFADIEVTRIVAGMNRLREQKNAAQAKQN